MATSAARRPLPALAFLLALSLLTALVWWRVLHRSESANAAPQPTCSTSSAPTVSAVPAPASVTVNVLNSTQKTGLAGQVTALLIADGFKTGVPANDGSTRAPVAGIAEIRYGPAGAAAAKLVSFYVVGATLVPDARTDASVDLAVGAKYTALVSAADVAKALAAAKLSQQPAPPSGTAPKPSGTAAKPSTTGSAASSAATSKSTSRSASTSATSC